MQIVNTYNISTEVHNKYVRAAIRKSWEYDKDGYAISNPVNFNHTFYEYNLITDQELLIKIGAHIGGLVNTFTISNLIRFNSKEIICLHPRVIQHRICVFSCEPKLMQYCTQIFDKLVKNKWAW